MWADRRKRHTVTFKVDDYEMQIIEGIAKDIGDTKGEAIRRALWVYRILYSPRLILKDALKENFDLDKPLCENLKPIPVLTSILKLDLELWRETTKRKTKKPN